MFSSTKNLNTGSKERRREKNLTHESWKNKKQKLAFSINISKKVITTNQQTHEFKL